MHSLARALTVALTIIYPFAIYIGIQYWGVGVLAILMLLIAIPHAANALSGKLIGWLWVAVCLGIAAWTWYYNSSIGLKFYPVIISLGMLCYFLWSLINPPTVIERFARLQHGELLDVDIRYTRGATIAWCVFFAVNGSIATAITLYGSEQAWALYNGLISYVFMGALFAGELFVRRLHYKKHHA